MSFTITCPICGKRDMYEFRFGNPAQDPVSDQEGLSARDYSQAVQMRRAVAGPQEEWWCHRDGCGIWFRIWRNTLTGRETDQSGAVS
ncbi:MAG: sarcosine oxidase subunit delta [Desulfarculaceae bacterium]|jgi:sarcosine oxidase subunit delta